MRVSVVEPSPSSGADFQRLADAIVEIVGRSARGLSGARGVAVIFNDDGFCNYLVEDSSDPLWAGQMDIEGKVSLDYLPTGLAFTLAAPASALEPRPSDPAFAL